MTHHRRSKADSHRSCAQDAKLTVGEAASYRRPRSTAAGPPPLDRCRLRGGGGDRRIALSRRDGGPATKASEDGDRPGDPGGRPVLPWDKGASCAMLVIRLATDRFGNETSWDLYRSGNEKGMPGLDKDGEDLSFV